MTKWLQAIRQSTTYLGVAVIVIIWGGICLLAIQEHESAYRDAVRQGGNLAARSGRIYPARRSGIRQLRCWSCGGTTSKNPQHFDLAGLGRARHGAQ